MASPRAVRLVRAASLTAVLALAAGGGGLGTAHATATAATPKTVLYATEDGNPGGGIYAVDVATGKATQIVQGLPQNHTPCCWTS